MGAGGAASQRAQDARRQERLLREQWQAARRQALRWGAVGEGEQRVLAQLLVLTARGWRLLVHRQWSGARTADADMLLVGPGGVFVIDVTAGGEPGDEHATGLLGATKAAESAVASLGMSPVAVQPLLVLAGRRFDASRGRIRLLGEQEIGPVLLSERHRLRAESVRAIADHLERVFPGYAGATVDQQPPPAPERHRPGSPDGLFDLEGLRDAALKGAREAPIEQWMTFLHPDQVALVRRNWAGPARISGPAGTGKTVVALHRAAHLARRTTGRILYVTFANNLPRVQSTFLKAMAPAVADRVDFRSLHSWAQEFLQERGVPVRLHGDKAETAFSLAWKNVGRGSSLAELDPAPAYWHEEIDHVIKGRGLTGFDEYVTVPRRRRKARLHRAHRQAVWELYEAYEALRGERGVHDFNDVLSLALAEAVRRRERPPYAAVIVDEVQDLTLVGVRLLHALVGDVPNGLLLVGDGQQTVYPGASGSPTRASTSAATAGRCCAPTTATASRSWKRPSPSWPTTPSRTSTARTPRAAATSTSPTTTGTSYASPGPRRKPTTGNSWTPCVPCPTARWPTPPCCAPPCALFATTSGCSPGRASRCARWSTTTAARSAR